MEGFEQHRDFVSEFVDPRNIDIWLPPSCTKDQARQYPVIYMHDGQFLFKPIGSYMGFGLRETMVQLVADNKIKETIIIGIWNTRQRFQEYAPQRPVEEKMSEEDLAALRRDGHYPTSDNYLQFIVKELKPFVDSTYPVLSDQKHTFVMGSSMGALVSAYAVCEYPNVFGGAGCLSTHWPTLGGMMIPYLEEKLPEPALHKFYFDLGTESIDSQYGHFQKQADQIMKQAGYTKGQNWISKKFVGDNHSAKAWGNRITIPLIFFLQKNADNMA
jgi:predicted alpha/beta superfamily hydrolase